MMFRIYAVLFVSLLVVAAGCTQSASTISPEMLSSYQSSLSLASEPDQAASVLEVRAMLGGAEATAHDHDDKGHHAADGHGHDTDSAEHDGHEHAEHAHDHEGHDDGDAHGKHEHPDGHEHGEDGQEHAAHEHDGHGHDDHEHAEHAHDHADHDHADHDHADHDHADHEHGDHGHSHAGDGREIVIVGKIGGAAGADRTLSDFPWEKGRATFIISDPAFEPAHTHDHDHDHGDDHDHGHSHADHECHYCQAKAVDAQAWVRFLGDDNKPIAVDARELFNVKEGDIVVVKGHAKLSAGVLVVDAKGIYVRR